MPSKVNIMISATKQLNETDESDIFLPIRTSEYRELVAQAEGYKAKYDELNAKYWRLWSELQELKRTETEVEK